MIFLAMLIALIPAVAGAQAPTTVFPPTGCSTNDLRVMAWQDGAPSTYCLTGQQVLDTALPICSEGQVITFRQHGRAPVGATSSPANFTCETPTTNGSVPTCRDGEFLTYRVVDSTGRFICAPIATNDSCPDCCTTPPTCSAGQMLKFANGDWMCVPLPVAPPAMSIVLLSAPRVLFVENLWKPTFPQLATDRGQYIAFSSTIAREGGANLNAPDGATHAIIKWHLDNDSADGNFEHTLALGAGSAVLDTVAFMDSGSQSGKPYDPVVEFNQTGEAIVPVPSDGKLFYSCKLSPNSPSIANSMCRAWVKGFYVTAP